MTLVKDSARKMSRCIMCWPSQHSQFTETDGLSPQAANELFIVMCHMMQTLQDKQCSIVVNKCYDNDFSRQYQAVMSGQTNMRQENIDALNMTQSILQHRTPSSRDQQQRYTKYSGQNQGNSRGGNQNKFGRKSNFKKDFKGEDQPAPEEN